MPKVVPTQWRDARAPLCRLETMVVLPHLPIGMNWNNPVVGETINRGEWLVLRVDPRGRQMSL
ncbi:hypothetical protein [Xanthomonas hortorum]|uniref:Uncharacterized protein n=1 Tax=Xanthomonas hortorum TaxID=56454 RepID=A0AA47EVJ0_9XANT|nr:hypothetical protein [Xanthomonas hortorum]WAH66127.1 hypothetical protein OEG85_09435 [Xanthomonas hortorum]